MTSIYLGKNLSTYKYISVCSMIGNGSCRVFKIRNRCKGSRNEIDCNTLFKCLTCALHLQKR